MGLTRRRGVQQRTIIIAVCVLVFLFWQTPILSYCTNSNPGTSEESPSYISDEKAPVLPAEEKIPRYGDAKYELPCSRLPGANDTVMIIKTGSTEFTDKLPVHLTTTTLCYPNYLIFSDHEEHYQGQHIIDALQDVSPDLRASHPDFELYRRINERGRAALAAEELNRVPGDPSAWTGHTDNPGWKLDKWKFLPMVNRTYQEYPDKKWYVFVEADTYILWASLLQWLKTMDHNEPHYHGNQMAISGDLFAHGGSGFIVSQKAMKMVVDHFYEHKEDIERFTDIHWAGDCVLGKAYRESGVPFTFSWPVLQTDHPGLIPYVEPDGQVVSGIKKRPWCFPTVSYHHVDAPVVEDLWKFEQQWIGTRDENDTGFLRHHDFFAQYTIPRMVTPKTDWDNVSDQNEAVVETFEDCRQLCEKDSGCKQYSLREGGVCRMSYAPSLGTKADGVRSGWMVDRMWSLHDNMPGCTDEGWL
ncbi:hypothetical protein LTR37_017620 [Vermiconidia calcicola]|uniref:Uncharacterized protein n=1 Tax=Vermiconidia calcicola TaxID=1690605 RepID=A0ACC3MKK1_9PEZI|nr:hypothetical protein LTR37_017620 [Vermiconidia calcicola]